MDQSRPRVALLIDGDNSTAVSIAALFAEAEKLGEIIIRRVYGNWSLPTMQGWQEPTIRYGLEQRHHGRTASGKNATDIALAIDAMDILYSGVVHHFCLATSDSDYTPLVMRLRSAGCTVLVVGKTATPDALKTSCTSFVAVDQNEAPSAIQPVSPQKPATAPKSEQKANLSKLAQKTKPRSDELFVLFLEAYEKEVQKGENEWVRLSALGTILKQNNSLFRPALYGYKNLHTFVNAYPDQLETRRQASKGKPILIRRKTPSLSLSSLARENAYQLVQTPQKKGLLQSLKEPALQHSPQPISASLFIQAYQNAAAKLQNEWVPVPNLSDALKQLDPNFSTQTYGYKNLPALVQNATGLFKTRKQTEGKSHHVEVWLLVGGQ